MGPVFLITTSWDDGHPSDERLADLLAKYGLKGTFYIPLAGPHEVIHKNAIRSLGKQFDIGAHSVSHSDFRRLSRSEAKLELIKSKGFLEEVTGQACQLFCFPRGHFSRRDLELASEIGYLGVRTTELFTTRPPDRFGNLFVIPTSVLAGLDSNAAYLRNLGRRRKVGALLTFLRRGRTSDWAKRAIALLSRAASDGGVFHLWGHSWEIDRDGQWNRLEDLFKMISEYRDTARFVSNTGLCEQVADF